MPLVTTVVRNDIVPKCVTQQALRILPSQVKKRQSYKTKAAKWVETDQSATSESDADSEPLAIDKIDGRSFHPITVQLEELVMEVDTGAVVSVISEERYDNLFS